MEKTTKNGIHRITQADGKTIAWAEESGVKVLEKDGYYFKDLAKTGELLPYEDWRLSDEERAADLAGRLSIEEIAGLMLYSPHQAVPPMPADLRLDDIQAKAAQSLYIVIDALAFSRDPLPAKEIYYLLHRHRVRLVGAAQ